jgi:hypothetical protein
LRDKNGVRVFKRSLNRERILESLSKHIVSGNEYDKSIASCFLEFLFDSDFNAKRADKYCRTLITIFGHDVFFKEDFRRSTERNKYFTSYSANGWYGFAHYYPETDTLVECPVIDMGNKKAIPAIKFSNEPERPFTLYRSAKNSNIDLSSYGGNNGH